jgi:hypothetical protein
MASSYIDSWIPVVYPGYMRNDLHILSSYWLPYTSASQRHTFQRTFWALTHGHELRIIYSFHALVRQSLNRMWSYCETTIRPDFPAEIPQTLHDSTAVIM